GRVVAAWSNLQLVVTGVEDLVVGRIAEVDPSEEILRLTGNAKVDRPGVRRGLDEPHARLSRGNWPEIDAGNRQSDVGAGAGDKQLVRLRRIEIEALADERLVNWSVGRRDLDTARFATGDGSVFGRRAELQPLRNLGVIHVDIDRRSVGGGMNEEEAGVGAI